MPSPSQPVTTSLWPRYAHLLDNDLFISTLTHLFELKYLQSSRHIPGTELAPGTHKWDKTPSLSSGHSWALRGLGAGTLKEAPTLL